jgi:hypothetical protein
MPATPKPPGQRRRRNVDQPTWRALPADGRKGKPPPLPRSEPPWSTATRDWWKGIWASSMATAWLPSDVPTLVRLARIVEADNRGEATVGLLAEARQLEDRFGLSPMARRRLQWEVARAGAEPEGAPTPGAQPRRPLADVRRLRAVDQAS